MRSCFIRKDLPPEYPLQGRGEGCPIKLHLKRPRLTLWLLVLYLLLQSAPRVHAQSAAPRAATPAASQPAGDNLPAYTLPPAKLAQAESLDRDENLLWIASTLWSVIALLLVLGLGWAAAFSRIAKRVTPRPGLQAWIFLPLLLLSLSLLDLPLHIIGHHIALTYHLSVEHWPAWLWDWTKGLLVSLIVGTLILSLLFAIVRRSPRRWWLWFWLLSLPLMVASVYLLPLVIDPLFNHFEPLTHAHQPLVQQLEQVVQKSGETIPPSRMFLMKASEKVTGLNAYVTGFGASKRVVVWDTSIQKASPDEILFIFGHELGHYVLRHILYGLLLGAAGLLLALFLGYHAVHWALRRFGPRWQISAIEEWPAAVVLLLVFAAFNIAGEPLQNAISRYIEHQADIYGQEVIHGIVADPRRTAVHSFQILGEESLDVPDPNPFIVFWTYSHPPITGRSAFARGYDPWLRGRTPRYFSKSRD
jgi:STE24 endopeptidase